MPDPRRAKTAILSSTRNRAPAAVSLAFVAASSPARVVAHQGPIGAEEHPEAIPLQAPYLIHVHLKDLSFKKTAPQATSGAVESLPVEANPTIPRVVGEGILPWQDILSTLQRTGYDGWLSIEYERRWYPDLLPPAEIGMKAAADLVRRILQDSR